VPGRPGRSAFPGGRSPSSSSSARAGSGAASAWLPPAGMGPRLTCCQRGPTRGLLPRVTSTNCSGCAGPSRNAWPQAARTCHQIRS